MSVHAALLAALLGLPQDPKPMPGWNLTLESAGAADSRDTRFAALYVPEGSPPSPFLAPGPFKAAWEGDLAVDIGTEVVFSAEGRGKLVVTARDKAVLEASGDDLSKTEGKPVMLKKGRNRVVVRYESPAKGDAWVRLFWASPQVQNDGDFGRETIPPMAVSHLPAGSMLRLGREVLATRRCLKCHSHDAKGMPELGMDAPSLAEAGARLNPDWMARWVENPRAIRPEATMPRLPGIAAADAADIAAYLSTLGKPAESRLGDAVSGGTLFYNLRCAGCHTLPDRDPAPGRIPFRHLAAKWRPAALVEFLKQPDRHYAWIEMPNFHLTDDEAAKLAGFLLSRPGQTVPAAAPGDPVRGHVAVEKLGCANCHTLPVKSALQAPALRQIPRDGWARGCKLDHGLSPAEKEAVTAFAATDLSALARESAPEFAERQIKALRCAACHKRDGETDFWSELADEVKDLAPKKVVKEDEFAGEPIEHVVPSLTWTGEKLKAEWMYVFLAGQLDYRPRPWLPARMPDFRLRAKFLAVGLVESHGCSPVSDPEPAPDAALAGVGLQLAGKQAPSFACLACHDVGAKKAVGVFEAPGPNLAYARERIRKEYFHRWMREPLRVEPGTKMPQFAPLGRSQLNEVLDGDASRQFEALWQYLLEGDKIRPPKE
jgi:cytochrome c1